MFLTEKFLADLWENMTRTPILKQRLLLPMDVNKRLFIDLEQVLISWEQYVHDPTLRGWNGLLAEHMALISGLMN